MIDRRREKRTTARKNACGGIVVFVPTADEAR
jgi:hypothetical protein